MLLRPRTLKDGDLAFLFSGHVLYSTIDIKYGDMEDHFVIAQSLLNLAEVLISIIVLAMHFRSDSRAPLLAFLVQAFVFWKTALYLIQYTPLCNGQKLVEHLDWVTYITLFLGTNGWWLVIPCLSLIHLWKVISSSINDAPDEHNKQQ